jgi:hypothetical protein
VFHTMPSYEEVLEAAPCSVRKVLPVADVDKLRVDLAGFRDRITNLEYEQSLRWINIMDAAEWKDQAFHWGEDGRLEPTAAQLAAAAAAAAAAVAVGAADGAAGDDDGPEAAGDESKDEAVGGILPRGGLSTSRHPVHVVASTGARFRVGDCCVLLASLDTKISDQGRLLRFHIARILPPKSPGRKMLIHWYSSSPARFIAPLSSSPFLL